MTNRIAIGDVIIIDNGETVSWTSGMAIDFDGAPNAYGPNDTGLDRTANAGHPLNWWGIVTNTGKPDGEPIVKDDGFYISTTALVDPSKPDRDQSKYVDSTKVPYISVPPDLLHLGVKKGDVAFVSFDGKGTPAIVADVGPRGAIGEGSPFCAEAIGISGTRYGGVTHGVTYTIWKGSTKGWPRSNADIAAQVSLLLGNF